MKMTKELITRIDLDYRLLQDVPENGPYGLPPSHKGQTLGQWYQGKVEEVVGATVTVRFATTTEPLRIFRKTLTDFPFPAFVNCFFEAGEYGDDIQYALRDIWSDSQKADIMAHRRALVGYLAWKA